MEDCSKGIIERLDRLTKLVTVGVIAGKPQREQIELLSKVGLQPKEIAELLGTTANTVSVSLTAIRKKGQK
jgi:DNA-binding NarL/FixJ family response regulator